MKGGAAGIHRFAKRSVEDPETLLRLTDRLTADPQDWVEHEYAQWSSLWSRLNSFAEAPWRKEEGGSAGGEYLELPMPGPKELRAAAMTFRVGTGTSNEVLSPRHYSWLSDILLTRVGQFLMVLERTGSWPEQVREALIHLLPKPAGGRRPIGLLASLVRLWERVRRHHVVKWRGEVHREYNWMSRGKGAERAVWMQTVMEEAAKQRGLASAAVLIDLVKAFEMIILARVWGAAKARGFPEVLLRLAMERSCLLPVGLLR